MKKRQAVSVILLVAFFLFQFVGCTVYDQPETTVSPATTIPVDSKEPNELATAVVAATFYHEAPDLGEQVAQGKLPPVSERLPANPMLIEPEDEVGQYGGTLQVPVPIVDKHLSLITYEPLVRWDVQWLRVIPNVAQVVDSNPDATTYTFHLRQGMRWSDGTPFTTDDILFWYEAVLSNSHLTPRIPGWLSTRGVPVSVTKNDDYSITFHFLEPNSLFLYNLASLLGQNPTRYPRHYLEQFHAAYNPEVDRLVAEAGVADWVQLFNTRSEVANPELPTLNAWVVREVHDGRLTAERNPYFWKIDTEFNQLPYIDEIVFSQVDSLVDYKIEGGAQFANLLFPDDFEDGRLSAELFENTVPTQLISSFSSDLVVSFNLNHPDPMQREMFQNRDVRQALSQAIDRQQILDTFFGGEGEPYQPAPRPESPYYQEELAHQFTIFDVALANKLLDEAGYGERDEEGFRLLPDGRRLTIRLQTTDTSQVPILEIIQQAWRVVDIDAPLTITNGEAYSQELFANQHDTFISAGVGGLDVLLQPVYYFPLHPFASWYATGWGQWYADSDNAAAMEPPAAVRQQMALYDQLKSTTNANEQAAFMKEILEITTQEFYAIGTVLDPNSVMLVSPNLRNVPKDMPLSVVDYPTPSPGNPAQFFIAQTN